MTSTSFYRSVWRWHFYAGLISLPFLILLALTGAAYLFQTEINDFIYRDLRTVEAASSAPKPPSELIASALQSYPGHASEFTPPKDANSSAEVGVTSADGSARTVYVDPYSRKVLGHLTADTAVMLVVRKLHSLAYFGPVANGLIEIVGGWCILLVATGIYLWWPRSHKGGVLTVRGQPKQRIFWRDVHAVTGVIAGVFIVFLALTGMPWSVFWGSYVNKWANSSNYGYPNGVRVNVPMSNQLLSESAGPTTWSLEQAKMPKSDSTVKAQPISIDAAVQKFDELGVARGYAVSLPTDPQGVFTASAYPKDLSKQRVVHLDQYSGQPLLDMSFKDYGPVGKSLEWGINVHMGQEFGLFNQLLMLAVCLAIILLSVSSGIMWWKRRPSGSLGAPPLPTDRRALRTIFGMLAVGGIIFPLVGLSMLAIAAFDFLWAINSGPNPAVSAHLSETESE